MTRNEKGNSDFINKHKKGCINAASVLMFIIIAGIVVCMTSCGKKDRQEVTEPSTTETEPATTEHPTTELPQRKQRRAILILLPEKRRIWITQEQDLMP